MSEGACRQAIRLSSALFWHGVINFFVSLKETVRPDKISLKVIALDKPYVRTYVRDAFFFISSM